MRKVEVLYGQTFLDIALQETGDLERCMELADAADLQLTAELPAGLVLEVPDPAPEKRSVVLLFSDAANKPASADPAEENNRLEGIGYWIIQQDFVVQ